MRIPPSPQHCFIMSPEKNPDETLLSLALFAVEAQSVTAELDRDRARDAQAQAHQVKYQQKWLLSFIHKVSTSLVPWTNEIYRHQNIMSSSKKLTCKETLRQVYLSEAPLFQGLFGAV